MEKGKVILIVAGVGVVAVLAYVGYKLFKPVAQAAEGVNNAFAGIGAIPGEVGGVFAGIGAAFEGGFAGGVNFWRGVFAPPLTDAQKKAVVQNNLISASRSMTPATESEWPAQERAFLAYEASGTRTDLQRAQGIWDQWNANGVPYANYYQRPVVPPIVAQGLDTYIQAAHAASGR